MSDLIRIASQDIVVTEVSGPGSNPRILEYAREVGFDSWYKDDDTSWCSLFLNWVALKAGLARSNNGRAESWSAMGVVVTEPEPGDIILLTNATGSSRITHAGIYTGFSQDKTRVYVLGGNQSNMVNNTGFRSNLIVGFRRLTPAGTPPIATQEPELRKGDRGPAVVALQDALKLLGFNAGTSDGDFGPRTEAALIAFQQSVPGLSATGVYNPETKKYLLEKTAALQGE
jgi:uncharacterized protein (TIGR02594 family)